MNIFRKGNVLKELAMLAEYKLFATLFFLHSTLPFNNIIAPSKNCNKFVHKYCHVQKIYFTPTIIIVAWMYI